jgi:outer membrane protein assembly factor BamA
MSTLSLGLEYIFINTDYRFNPRRGSELSVSASAGRKEIRQNNAVTQIKDPSFNYGALYDSIRRNSYQLRFRLSGARYFPVAKQAALKIAVQAGWLETPNYFRNEMFQLGGYHLLRGFDEESIYANRFAVAGIEYRYLVDLNSYFFGFVDAGWSNFKNEVSAFDHTYIGVGGGMAFQLKQGIFNISYALGKRDDVRLNLRQSKIHFGYTSFF